MKINVTLVGYKHMHKYHLHYWAMVPSISLRKLDNMFEIAEVNTS